MVPAFLKTNLRARRVNCGAQESARVFTGENERGVMCRPHFPHLHRHVNARKLLADTRLLASLQWPFSSQNQNGQAVEPN
jgi:hypothetical protein